MAPGAKPPAGVKRDLYWDGDVSRVTPAQSQPCCRPEDGLRSGQAGCRELPVGAAAQWSGADRAPMERGSQKNHPKKGDNPRGFGAAWSAGDVFWLLCQLRDPPRAQGAGVQEREDTRQRLNP